MESLSEMVFKMQVRVTPTEILASQRLFFFSFAIENLFDISSHMSFLS